MARGQYKGWVTSFSATTMLWRLGWASSCSSVRRMVWTGSRNSFLAPTLCDYLQNLFCRHKRHKKSGHYFGFKMADWAHLDRRSIRARINQVSLRPYLQWSSYGKYQKISLLYGFEKTLTSSKPRSQLSSRTPESTGPLHPEDPETQHVCIRTHDRLSCIFYLS